MSPAAPIDVSLPGIEERENEHELLHHGVGSPLGSRRPRTRGSRTHGGEENPKRSVSASTSSTAISTGKRPLRPTSTAAFSNTHTGDDTPFTRAHQPTARSGARPRPLAREQEREQGRVPRGGASCERRKSWLSVLSPKKLFRKRRSVAEASDDFGSHPQDAENWEPEGARIRRVSSAEWRAYGMWARPKLGKRYGDIIVRNATPLNPPRELSPPQTDAMFASLWEDGRPHPERWIPRVEHWSLPPRPSLWPTPRQRYDPLPQELQLNPFLEHRLVGRPLIHFDLRMRAEDITLGERPPPPSVNPYTSARSGADNGHNSLSVVVSANPTSESSNRDENDRRRIIPFWCDGPNGAQPATYPGVPRLRITGLAGDPQHEFPWPVTVMPHHEALPVLVCDVVNALIANFEERMTVEEIEALSEGRKIMLYQAYWRRIRFSVGGTMPPDDDGLRRVDYLGDAVYFRGLEPHPRGDGFMLFMGPPP
ncbi:hypothetical protein DICSQDRAFT_139466 [Dichomitus squalens LYAD-421 SS1]|uniref:DUF6699 domain-containing protein n=1 Tax=Dichomitus squalens (strain LYAD-421) TaxID=732165 RepID=R7SRJ4_DICSQ|nr:uncharacterized protein DICSQDRAFT_139466 [Dichomitus squalens LYAD-421 SS1]EJF58385.1 hypothetical protein DICSQDRAFT_139466 [Dichomitus squalens LYAD-421 SS1]